MRRSARDRDRATMGRAALAAMIRPMAAGLLLTLAIMAGAPFPAWPAEDEETELAKKTQNPVADLISVPLQNNFNFNTGEKDATVWILNVQPVVPIKLTEDWNLITRTIIPIVNQPSLFEGPNRISGSAWGLGDINPSFFFSPAKPSPIIWGIGPTFTLPTATDFRLGSGKFSLGPTAVALTMQGPWVVGALVNNQWSVAGSDEAAVLSWRATRFSMGWTVA